MKFRKARLAILASLLTAAPLGAAEMRLRDGVVEATRLDESEVEGSEIAVWVDAPGDLPAIAGESAVEGGVLRFTPAFSFSPGMSYRAELKIPGADSEVMTFEIPRSKQESATFVTHVHPKVEALPENLLKFYIHFSAPMLAGGNYRHLRLLDSKGEEVDLPFLELDEELWDQDQRRLTVFLDPARIKRGLVPHEKEGRALRTGKSYTLVVGRGFEDAARMHLIKEHRKTFKVSEPDYDQPLLKNWIVSTPAGGTRETLVVELSEPLDHGLLQRVIQVENMQGEIRISKNDTRWEFVPVQPWKPGACHILVGTILEDLAGNSLQRPFEVLPGLPFIENLKETERLRFEVRDPKEAGAETG